MRPAPIARSTWAAPTTFVYDGATLSVCVAGVLSSADGEGSAADLFPDRVVSTTVAGLLVGFVFDPAAGTSTASRHDTPEQDEPSFP